MRTIKIKMPTSLTRGEQRIEVLVHGTLYGEDNFNVEHVTRKMVGGNWMPMGEEDLEEWGVSYEGLSNHLQSDVAAMIADDEVTT